MLNRDGDDHRRLRRLVTKAFTPKMVEQLRPRIQAIADELLDAVESRREMDLSGLRLAVPRQELEWRPTPGFRRLVALPVTW